MLLNSQKAAAIIHARTGGAGIDVGLILGSGLSAIADHVLSPTVISSSDLPGFSHPAHNGSRIDVVIGQLGTARVAVLRGSMRYHETGDITAMRVPLETLKLLGANAVVFTTAAGSVRPDLKAGSLVALRDHINLTGLNPLIAARDEGRFVDMTGAYDPVLRERFAVAASESGGRKTSEGVLMWFPGPTFETPAEVSAARALGADLVGMSTVPAVVVARHLGLRVMAVATVTNQAAGLSNEPLRREGVMRVAGAAIVPLTRVLLKFFDIWVLDSRSARAMA